MPIRSLPEMDISIETLNRMSRAKGRPEGRDPLDYLETKDPTESFSVTEALAVGLREFLNAWRRFPPGTLCEQGAVSNIRFDHGSGKFKALVQDLRSGEYEWFETDTIEPLS